MSSLKKDLFFLVMQFLGEDKYNETMHKLEQESGLYFNMKYFEKEVESGNWDEVERYLSGFTKIDSNTYSTRIFFEVRKQKYLEALDRHDQTEILDILVKDLKVFAEVDQKIFMHLTELLTLENFRENAQLTNYGDTKSARAIVLGELKKLIESNPVFQGKLLFPGIQQSRLRTLINQSVNWQHRACQNPRPNPEIATLFCDHLCNHPNGPSAPQAAVTHPVISAGEFIGLATGSNPEAGTGNGRKSGRRPHSVGVGDGASSSGAARANGLNGEGWNPMEVKPIIETEELDDKSKFSKITEINELVQCRSLTLVNELRTSKISRLIYNNAGNWLIVLSATAINLFWKWPPNIKATASVPARLWKLLTLVTWISCVHSNVELFQKKKGFGAKMSSLKKDLFFLVMQFLGEDKYNETMHKLEQESGLYFNMKYFEKEVESGNWDEVERYLSGFTKIDSNTYSTRIFFEVRKQKYLEALDRHDPTEMLDILVKDLKVFAEVDQKIFKHLTELLTLGNFRENAQLTNYGDTKSARAIVLGELKKLIESNPVFHGKLLFPNIQQSRLRTLISQSVNWQHRACQNPRPNPEIATLFCDHRCNHPNGPSAPQAAVTHPVISDGEFIGLATGSNPEAATGNGRKSGRRPRSVGVGVGDGASSSGAARADGLV